MFTTGKVSGQSEASACLNLQGCATAMSRKFSPGHRWVGVLSTQQVVVAVDPATSNFHWRGLDARHFRLSEAKIQTI